MKEIFKDYQEEAENKNKKRSKYTNNRKQWDSLNVPAQGREEQKMTNRARINPTCEALKPRHGFGLNNFFLSLFIPR